MKRLNSIVSLVSILVVAVLYAAQAYAQPPTIRKPASIKLESLFINQQSPVGEVALALKIVASDSRNYADTDSRDLTAVARRSFGRLTIEMQNSEIRKPSNTLKTSGRSRDRPTAFHKRE